MRPGAIPILYFDRVDRGLMSPGDWYAEAAEVILALENHPAIGTAPRDFLRILEFVDDERLKVNLDTPNPMESGASVLDLLPRVISRVVHVHASDRNADLSHVARGTGVVPLREVLAQLRAAGLSGTVSVEIRGKPERASVEAPAANMRRIWSEAACGPSTTR